VWEVNDPAIREKIARFACTPELVTWSQSAERDMASTAEMTKGAVLDALVDHLSCGYVVHADYMRNGDVAYIFQCFVGRYQRYVKLKFWTPVDKERMHVFSAHPNR
jgi:hypothetical protein